MRVEVTRLINIYINIWSSVNALLLVSCYWQSFSHLIITGEKISPIEVDAVLVSHPEIAQAVAFGVPDDKYGEEVRL